MSVTAIHVTDVMGEDKKGKSNKKVTDTGMERVEAHGSVYDGELRLGYTLSRLYIGLQSIYRMSCDGDEMGSQRSR